jgi:hypothetical protein
MAGHGGYRPGSGRPKGSKNRRGSRVSALRNKQIIEEARREGLTPLEYMLGVLRDEKAEQSRRDEMSWRCAPYLHPRLTALAVHNTSGVPPSDIYVAQINVVSIESGRYLTKEEIETPIVEVLPDDTPLPAVPEFLAVEVEATPPSEAEDPSPSEADDSGQ